MDKTQRLIDGMRLSAGPDVIGPAAPMPTAEEAWKARFMNRIIERLSDRYQLEGWSREQAITAAEAEYNGLDEPIDLTDDPVASADESMSYWDADE
jgi:hypothetical protein